MSRVLRVLPGGAQFVDEPELKMTSDHIATLASYLRQHREVATVLITRRGPDEHHRRGRCGRYIEPLPRTWTTSSPIRIGTKSLAYWPQRYVTDTTRRTPRSGCSKRWSGQAARWP